MFKFNITKLTIKVLFYLVGIPEERDFHMLFKHENAYKLICNFERFCLKRICYKKVVIHSNQM